LIATSVIVLAGSTGIASSASKSKATNQAVQRALTEVMKQKNGPPGISMLITRNGNSQYYGRGIRNRSSKKPVARGLHFRIASVAKTFNGAVALSLVQQGQAPPERHDR
jgi:CubicO group peptidase (beta-lactamase class C family)